MAIQSSSSRCVAPDAYDSGCGRARGTDCHCSGANANFRSGSSARMSITALRAAWAEKDLSSNGMGRRRLLNMPQSWVQKVQLETISASGVNVRAVLHCLSKVVKRGTAHGDQGSPTPLFKQLGLLGGRISGADCLRRAV